MDFFKLPERTEVGRVVPKNAFDEYINTKQKKLFTDCIQRITWTNKLSPETVNLDADDIHEIQVFKVDLKQKTDILKVLEVINKSIPYHIVFWVEHSGEAYISTSSKHLHATNENIAVIDWTFTTDWFRKTDNPYTFNLKSSLDAVFKDLCVQILGQSKTANDSMGTIVQKQKQISRLEKQIKNLKSAIKKTKQFNQKVELNLKLKEAEVEYRRIC